IRARSAGRRGSSDRGLGVGHRSAPTGSSSSVDPGQTRLADHAATPTATRPAGAATHSDSVRPSARKATTAATPAVTAYGSWVFTWSTWSQEDPAEDSTVVSEIGEQWSPKIPPLKTAAVAAARDRSREAASGIAIGSMMAKVP